MIKGLAGTSRWVSIFGGRAGPSWTCVVLVIGRRGRGRVGWPDKVGTPRRAADVNHQSITARLTADWWVTGTPSPPQHACPAQPCDPARGHYRHIKQNGGNSLLGKYAVTAVWYARQSRRHRPAVCYIGGGHVCARQTAYDTAGVHR